MIVTDFEVGQAICRQQSKPSNHKRTLACSEGWYHRRSVGKRHFRPRVGFCGVRLNTQDLSLIHISEPTRPY